METEERRQHIEHNAFLWRILLAGASWIELGGKGKAFYTVQSK